MFLPLALSRRSLLASLVGFAVRLLFHLLLLVLVTLLGAQLVSRVEALVPLSFRVKLLIKHQLVLVFTSIFLIVMLVVEGFDVV